MIAVARFVDGGELRVEHDFVDGALLGTETSVNRNRPRDVGGIEIQFTAGVDQQQVAVLELSPVGYVVQRAGIPAAADDRTVRRPCISLAEFVQEFRFDLEFELARPRGTHGPLMSSDRDLCGAPHRADFCAALVQAHIVQQVIERDEFLRRVQTP